MKSVEDRESALRRAGERLLRKHGLPDARGEDAPWSPHFFRLERVARFRDAAPAARRAVLDGCAASLLSESWFIERCGVTFCARMTLLADNAEEKRVFALIGADEATHSAWLDPWVPRHDERMDPFNRFISGLVESGSAQPLAFLMQVVLEGFGIVHYGRLGAACLDPALAATLKRMARDEALHHAAGLAVFDAARLTAPERRFLADGAREFLEMVRNGPQAAVAALDRAVGIGDGADAAGIFEDLATESETSGKLGEMRRLMARPGMKWLVDELDSKGVFAPCTPAECSQIYVAAR